MERRLTSDSGQGAPAAGSGGTGADAVASDRVAIILVRPREEGNVGAVARAMANMALKNLFLVEPAPPIGGVARGFGVGGWDVLDRVQRVSSVEDAIAPFERVIGTTSTRERELRQARILNPREMVELLRSEHHSDRPLATAILFGPENNGLSRDELDLCHPVVAIPASREHPTLNLSQAVMVLAYELFMADLGVGTAGEQAIDPPAPAIEVAGLMEQVDGVLHDTGFDDREIHSGLMRDLRRILRRSDASRREVRVLRRIVNRLRRRLDSRADGVLRAEPQRRFKGARTAACKHQISRILAHLIHHTGLFWVAWVSQ